MTTCNKVLHSLRKLACPGNANNYDYKYTIITITKKRTAVYTTSFSFYSIMWNVLRICTNPDSYSLSAYFIA